MSYVSNCEQNNERQAGVVWDIMNKVRSFLGGYQAVPKLVLSSYMICKLDGTLERKEIDYTDILLANADVAQDMLDAFANMVSPEEWDKIYPVLAQYPKDVLISVIEYMNYNMSREMENYTTPLSVIRLAQMLLQCQAGEEVADFCSGVGNFIIDTAKQTPEAQYSGYDLHVESVNVAKVRAELADVKVAYQLENVFNLNQKTSLKFDKIFSHFPYGLKSTELGAGKYFLDDVLQKYPNVPKRVLTDWIFSFLMLEKLNQEGKAVCVLPASYVWNSTYKEVRKVLCEQGLVECVITLPKNMFQNITIQTAMIVYSHGNEAVRLVDASNVFQKGRRQNEFTHENLQLIYQATLQDGEISKLISPEELQNNEWNFGLSRYVDLGIEFENGVPFESVMKRVTRGANITARQLDELVTNDITDMQYLMLSNIQDGVIQKDLPYLSKIEPKHEKYCLKNHDFIISKNNFPYKTAVAEIRENQKVLANGNLYIIELDESKVNPYYLKAFFDSQKGLAVLKRITVGDVMTSIAVDQLKKLMIPLHSMEEQNRVAQAYQATMDEVAVLKLKLEKAIAHLHDVYDTESGE